MRIDRRAALGALAGVAALAATGLSAQEALTPVKIGALRLTSHAPSFIALERGYFEEAGLEPELVFFEAAQPMAVAIASGDIDYGMTAITGGLISLANKGAVKVIGGALAEEQGVPGQMILASSAAYDAGLKTPADLDGKRIGVTQPGSSFHYMGDRIARAEEATASFTPLQKVPALVGALKSGQIDAWPIVPSIGASLVESGAAKNIGMVADYLPDYQVTTVFTSATNAAEARDKTEAFLEALSRGIADYNAAHVDKTTDAEEQEAVTRTIHNYVYSDQPFEKASQSILGGAMRINEGAALNMDSIRDQLDWFRETGLIDEGADVETLVDASYVETR